MTIVGIIAYTLFGASDANKRIPLIKYLLDNGADYTKKDWINFTPLDLFYDDDEFTSEQKKEIQDHLKLMKIR